MFSYVSGRLKFALCVGAFGLTAVGIVLASFYYRKKRHSQLSSIKWCPQRRQIVGYADLRSVLPGFPRLYPNFTRRSCLSPDPSSFWVVFPQKVNEETAEGSAFHYRLVICHFSLLTLNTVPVLVLDNYLWRNFDFFWGANCVLIEAESTGRIDLLIYDFNVKKLRRMRLEVPDEEGDNYYQGLYFDLITAFPDTIFMFRLVNGSPRKVQVFRYERAAESEEWEIRKIVTRTFLTEDPSWHPLLHCTSSKKIILMDPYSEQEWHRCYIYDGNSDSWDVKAIEDMEVQWQIPLEFMRTFLNVWQMALDHCLTGTEKQLRRAFMVDEATEETGKCHPIYAVDLQPRSLKGLAFDCLLKNFPSMKDLDGGTLKEVGIAPPVVDEMSRHKALEDAEDIPIIINLDPDEM